MCHLFFVQWLKGYIKAKFGSKMVEGLMLLIKLKVALLPGIPKEFVQLGVCFWDFSPCLTCALDLVVRTCGFTIRMQLHSDQDDVFGCECEQAKFLHTVSG